MPEQQSKLGLKTSPDLLVCLILLVGLFFIERAPGLANKFTFFLTCVVTIYVNGRLLIIALRVKDPINGHGMRLEAFSRNAVWLFGHGIGNLQLPIGTARNPHTGAVEVQKTETQMTARIYFSQTLPEAAAIFALVDEDILRAASVLFRPLKARHRKLPQENKCGTCETQTAGLDFVESDLMEISIVPIGADAGANLRTVERGHIAGSG